MHKRRQAAMRSIVALGALLALGACAMFDARVRLADAVPGLESYAIPFFPEELRTSDLLDGYATVAFTVAGDGAIEDAVVLRASHVAFGDAVLRVLPRWHVAPGPAKNRPRRDVVDFNFRRTNFVTTANHYDAAEATFAHPPVDALRSVSAAQLEMPLQRSVMTAPQLSKTAMMQLDKAATPTAVAVNFIVDIEGRVRVPVVDASVDPRIADAVLTAVKRWRYAPPQYDGKPVTVDMTHAFALVTPPAAQ